MPRQKESMRNRCSRLQRGAVPGLGPPSNTHRVGSPAVRESITVICLMGMPQCGQGLRIIGHRITGADTEAFHHARSLDRFPAAQIVDGLSPRL
jgi:hypothetical protein